VSEVAHEGVVSVFERAIGRALKPWTSEERERVLELVRGVLRQLREGRVTPEEAYYELVGVAYEHLVPITPRDMSELKRLLGLK
jgi:hypothetical protein